MPDVINTDGVDVYASPRRSLVAVIALSALLGVVVAAGFELFETVSHELRTLIWVEWAGEDPSAFVTIALASAGGLAVGLILMLVPGKGGGHPADDHGLISAGAPSPAAILGIMVAGLVALVAGASLGPEGALIPAVAGLGAVVAKRANVPAPMQSSVAGAGLGALLATMFGSPLAGAVPLLEVVPASGLSMVMLILPALVASSTAVLTLEMMNAEAAGYLQLGYEGFARGDIVWALLVGILAGGVAVVFNQLTVLLRRVTKRLDARSVILSTTAGGVLLGVSYAIGGTEVRFAGIPELQLLVADTGAATTALVAVGAKVFATSVCLAAGYRGGKIFPLAFMGGAIGLAAHLVWNQIPLSVAVAAGLAGAIAVGLSSPVTAALIAAAVVGPELLPLAVLAVVSAHVVHVISNSAFAANARAMTGGGPDAAPETSQVTN